MAEQRQSQKDRLKEITDGIEKGIKELFESEKYKQYLRTMSRFPRYSLNNTILIYLQNPNATLVAGYQRWKDQFERYVRKGEKGLKIIAPTPYKTKKEVEKVDPITKNPVRDATGNVLTEEVEVKIPMFKPVTVFDVSQTEGKPLPELVSTLNGEVTDYSNLMEALRRTAPVPISFEEMKPNTDGYFSYLEQRIGIRSGMSEVQTVSATIHEIAHSILHNQSLVPTATMDREQIKELVKNRRTKEVEAESVSYTVCSYYGIETNENSFGYIASWSKDKELPELKASLELINQTANQLIIKVDGYLAEIRKEKETVSYDVVEEVETATAIVKDSYRILQLNREEGLQEYRFESLEKLEELGLRVEEMNYHETYEGIFMDEATTNERLHALYQQFNFNPPKEFTGHSLAVSDIIALQEQNVISYYYVDDLGFQELPGFSSTNNPFRSLEDSVEQNDNNLDGIINNLPPVLEPKPNPNPRIEQNQFLMLQKQARNEEMEQKERKKSVREKLQQSSRTQVQKKSVELIDGR